MKQATQFNCTTRLPRSSSAGSSSQKKNAEHDILISLEYFTKCFVGKHQDSLMTD